MQLGNVWFELVVMAEAQVRTFAVFVVIELVIVALNRLPDTPEKWEAKQRAVIRRFCWCLALMITELWLATL